MGSLAQGALTKFGCQDVKVSAAEPDMSWVAWTVEEQNQRPELGPNHHGSALTFVPQLHVCAHGVN